MSAMEDTKQKNTRALTALIFNMYTLAQLAAFRGLLILEDWIDSVRNETLKKGLELIVNGTDPEELDVYFEQKAAGEPDPDRKLRIDLVRRGVGMILSGENPESMRWQLCVGLDDPVRDGLLELLLDWERKKYDFYGNLSSVPVDPVLREEVEQVLLYEFAWKGGFVTALMDTEALCTALRGCAPHLQIRVIDVLPVIECRRLIKRYEADRPDAGEVRAAMQLLMDWYRFAIGQGEYPGAAEENKGDIPADEA